MFMKQSMVILVFCLACHQIGSIYAEKGSSSESASGNEKKETDVFPPPEPFKPTSHSSNVTTAPTTQPSSSTTTITPTTSSASTTTIKTSTSTAPTTTPVTTTTSQTTTSEATTIPTTNVTTTPAPLNTTSSATTTPSVHPTQMTTVPPTGEPSKDRRFDGPSFIGGIVLSIGIMAIAFVSWKFYKARSERNYHTL